MARPTCIMCTKSACVACWVLPLQHVVGAFQKEHGTSRVEGMLYGYVVSFHYQLGPSLELRHEQL